MIKNSMIKNGVLSAALVASWLFASAGSVGAEPFAMSSIIRNYCCDNWTNRDDPTSPAPNPGGGAFLLFPGRVVAQQATVNRTVDQNLATAPFEMVIPASRLGFLAGAAGLPHPNPLFDRLTLDVDGQNLQGTMMANGGPGDFDFCPIAVGPSPGACLAPLSATSGPSSLPVHGRLHVEAGVNQYGGAMGWLGAGLVGVINARNAEGAAATLFTARYFAAPFKVVGDGTTPAGIIAVATQNAAPSTFFSTSRHWEWPTPSNTTQTCSPNCTAMDNPAYISVVNGPGAATGHVWTTGMVTASITAGNVPPFQAVTLTGSDNRATTGPDIGSGNLTLVSANLYQDYNQGVPQVRGNALELTVPEPGAALAVAAGAIALVLAGASRRRA